MHWPDQYCIFIIFVVDHWSVPWIHFSFDARTVKIIRRKSTNLCVTNSPVQISVLIVNWWLTVKMSLVLSHDHNKFYHLRWLTHFSYDLTQNGYRHWTTTMNYVIRSSKTKHLLSFDPTSFLFNSTRYF